MTEHSLKNIRLPALVVILGGAFALRMNLAVKAFYSTFDTSTVGLMALRILKEGERPLFYYGQDYMGALEAYSAALLFALFGPSTTVLSLAPTLFALGWVFATYLLFAEIFGIAGGLAAALTASVCGWYPLWFTMASYGGYPETFLFGTIFLWIVVRICFRPVSSAGLFGLAAAAGVIAALGIWTNFQVLSYLVAGGLVAAAALLDREKRHRLLAPLGVTAVIALLGLVPLFLMHMDTGVGIDHFVQKRPIHLHTNLKMFLVAMQRQFHWPETALPGLREAGLLSLAGTLALCLWSIPRNVREKKEAVVPLIFILVFLVLFLLHPKAATGATRYTIPLMSMGTSLFFAAAVSVKKRVLRGFAWLFLALWTGYNGTSAVATAAAKSAETETIRESRREIVVAAEDLELRHVEIVGSEIDGLDGQTLTFYAGDRVRFVAIINERHLPSAEAADRDDRAGLFCKEQHFEKVRDSLVAAGISFRHQRVAEKVILYDLEPPTGKYRSVQSREMEVDLKAGRFAGLADHLVDRDDATGIKVPAGARMDPFEIDVTLRRTLAVGGITFFSPFPGWAAGAFFVSGSLDGKEFFSLSGEMKHPLPVSRAGNKALILRPFNPVELRFAPQAVKYLKIRISPEKSSRMTWHLSEMFLFEHRGDGTPVTGGEVDAIRVSLLEKSIDFCAADPWLSARLSEPQGGVPVYRRYNRRHGVAQLDRNLALRPGLAFVIDESLGAEAESVLTGVMPEGLTLQQEKFGHYRLLTFTGNGETGVAGGPVLTWNDQMVLKVGNLTTAQVTR